MLFALRYLAVVCFRFLLWLRYRIQTKGLDQVAGLKGPTLILPNHPAFVDPLIVYTRTFGSKRPRPMLLIEHFKGFFLGTLMKLLNAAEVPPMGQFDAKAREKARKAVQDVIDGLKRGENFVMWPSGRLQRDGLEHLGSAAALTEILRAVPEVNLVVVRTRGLWGSWASYAYTGKLPDLLGSIPAALGWVLANLIFFMPRRTVTQTYQVVDKSQLPPREVDRVNPWFEAWYNAEGQEPPTFVPYHWFLGPREYEYPPPPTVESVDVSKIRPEVRAEADQIIRLKIEERRGAPDPDDQRELTPETTLESLGFDSLSRMDLQLAVERRFAFHADETPATVGQVYALAAGLSKKGRPKPAPKEWFKPASSTDSLVLAETIPAAFVERALTSRHDVAEADDLAGVVTYEKMLIAVLAMADRFRKLDGDNVGLLLPASVAADIALHALLMAGKLPVVLNWTTGPANLAHAARLMNLRHVVTSKAFVNRTAIEVTGTQFVFLEDVRATFGKVELLRRWLGVRWFPGSVRASVPRLDPDQPAVVLFTSGSEKAPKAVPLTHRNLIANIRMGVAHIGLTRADVMLGFLPPFHSFGMSVTGLLPLLSGIRVVRHPDPTDTAGLVQKLADYRPTMLLGTPAFVGFILERAEPAGLASLRLVIVGAEKCPPGVFQRVAEKAPKAQVIEGYGITECSPIVAANRPTNNKPGSIGLPLPGVEVRLVDLETHEPVQLGDLGLLLVAGPTVFPGYLGYEGEPPFVERDGRQWYVTGDLAVQDEDGFFHFRGRLKRFLKAGGEMISLPALEEPLALAYPPVKDLGPQVAIEGVERDHHPHIVLFTTVPTLTLREANRLLEQAGFQGVMRLNEVRPIEKIPVLGTGKTDYKVLRAML